MNLGIVINKINTLMNNKLQLKVIVNTTSSDNEIIERYTTLYNQMMYGSSNKLNFDEYAMNTNMQQVYDNLSNTSHNDKVLIKYDSYSQISKKLTFNFLEELQKLNYFHTYGDDEIVKKAIIQARKEGVDASIIYARFNHLYYNIEQPFNLENIDNINDE
jgi:hypothetical protein